VTCIVPEVLSAVVRHQESNKNLSYCYLLDFCCRILITISKFILLAKLSLVLPDVPTGPNDWHCLCPILQRMNLARMAHCLHTRLLPNLKEDK
jgi:hypothetical protein